MRHKAWGCPHRLRRASAVLSDTIFSLFLVLVGLYEEPEKPSNAVDYVKRFMGAPTGIDVEAIRAENDELKKKVAELTSTVSELNKRLTSGEDGEDEEEN